MNSNPFKFGTIVSDEYFTNRRKEIDYVLEFLNSPNHLLVSSPRRFGKTSLILKCVKKTKRPWIYIDIQLMTSVADFCSQLLRRIYHRFPVTHIKSQIKNFRILPQISVNPLTNDYSVSFNIAADYDVILEDVFNLIRTLTKKHKIIFIMDEFQDIQKLQPNFDKQLRAHMQHCSNINFIFMGSRESMIRDIFTIKNSAFYRFASLFQLEKISQEEFISFVSERFQSISSHSEEIAETIVELSQAHPYYTQQLASATWQQILLNGKSKDCVQLSLENIVRQHDNDFERLWVTFNQTDKKLLLAMAQSDLKPLSNEFMKKWNIAAPSTVYSTLKKLIRLSYILHIDKSYELEDPFFKTWLIKRRNIFLD